MAKQNGSSWGKRIIILVIVVVIIGGVAWYFNSDREEAPQYQTTAVTQGDLTQLVTASGTLNPVINVQVGSQISGNILKLYADFNSLVKSNQVVAELDSAIFQASVHQAEGDLANAHAGLELAQVNAKRSADLFQSKLIPASDNDKAVADLHQAEALVKIKEASVERAKVDLAHCTIYAPVDGIVISRNVDVGQTVAASMNAPTLFVIANDLSKMQIDSNVSEADVGSIEDGQATTFTVDAFPGRNFVGKVVQIRNAPITVQNVVTYDTVIGVNNPDQKLKPGMTATISITTGKRTGVLKVPNAALRFKMPEPATNHGLISRWLGKLGNETKTNSTNAALLSGSSGTNQAAEAKSPPLTGNEPPEELARRVREMRDRGEEVPAEIRAKIRELYQSGALQRSGGGQGGGGAGGGARPQRPAQPTTRTIYVLNTESVGKDNEPKPQPVKVKTGISDGVSTEITEGLKAGDQVVISVKTSQPAAPASPSGSSPFGGGRRGF